MAQQDVVDTDAVRHDDAGKSSKPATRLSQLLGPAVVEKVEAARAKVREQFQTHVAQAQTRIADLEKRAQSLVGHVQATAHTAVDRVREEKNEAVQKVEQVAHDVGARLEPYEHLLKLPAEVREDLLTNLGIASGKQVAQLHEEVAALSAEITAQFVAQTEILAQLLEKQGHAEATTALRETAPKPRGRKKGPAAEA